MIKDFNIEYATTHYKSGESIKTLTVTGTYNGKAVNVTISEDIMRDNHKKKGGKETFEEYVKDEVTALAAKQLK